MREIISRQPIYWRCGKWGQTNTTTIARWGHEPIISNGYEDIMREIKQSVYIGETEKGGNQIPQPPQHEHINQPCQMVQCTRIIPHTPRLSFSVKYICWRRLNGVGPFRELGLRDCAPGTLDNGRKREKRHSRREYAIHPRVQCRQWRVEP